MFLQTNSLEMFVFVRKGDNKLHIALPLSHTHIYFLHYKLVSIKMETLFTSDDMLNKWKFIDKTIFSLNSNSENYFLPFRVVEIFSNRFSRALGTPQNNFILFFCCSHPLSILLSLCFFFSMSLKKFLSEKRRKKSSVRKSFSLLFPQPSLCRDVISSNFPPSATHFHIIQISSIYEKKKKKTFRVLQEQFKRKKKRESCLISFYCSFST